jgi:hypothetical protein
MLDKKMQTMIWFNELLDGLVNMVATTARSSGFWRWVENNFNMFINEYKKMTPISRRPRSEEKRIMQKRMMIGYLLPAV